MFIATVTVKGLITVLGRYEEEGRARSRAERHHIRTEYRTQVWDNRQVSIWDSDDWKRPSQSRRIAPTEYQDGGGYVLVE